ncbi:MAG: hypothetical protein Q4G64_01355 [bacterium]|nr:hypothetical protein [bacterium]
MDASDPSIAPPETPAELSVQVTPWNDEDRDALRNSIESLGLAVDRIDLLTPMPGLIAATSPSLVDGALVDPRSNNTITFTIGQYVDELPRDSVPLVERFHAIEVPGAGEALHLTTEEYSQFVLVREGGGPLIVVTVSPGLPGAGEALSDDSVKLAQDQLLSLLLSDGEA